MKNLKPLVVRITQCIFILTFMLMNKSLAQNRTIDSLEALLHSSHPQTSEILVKLVYEHFDSGDLDKVLKYTHDGIKAANSSGDTLTLVKMVRLKAHAFRNLNRIDSSLNLLMRILPLAKGNKYVEEIKFILNGIAVCHTVKASYDQALKYYFEILEFPLGAQGVTEETVLGNIGIVYYKLQEYHKAATYFKDALKIRVVNNRYFGYEMELINTSLCYAHLDSLAEAKRYLNQAKSWRSQELPPEVKMLFCNALGIVLMKEGKNIDAKAQFLESYSLANQVKDERLRLDNIILLSEISIQQNRFNEAEGYLRDAERTISEGSPYNLELIKIYARLVFLYSKSNDYKRMSFYQNRYIQLRDSVYNEAMTNNLMRIHAEHLEKENKARIESQNKILALNDEVIHQQKIANVSFGGAAFLLVLLTILLAKNNLQRKKMNALLDKKVKERTKELEMNQDTLQRAWHERDVLIKKASEGIQSSIATIRGLSSLGEREIDHPKASEYWSELNMTSTRLSSIVNKMRFVNKQDTTGD
ncbi:tetratricopeptide repeat protein [Chryseolinea sp. H1M3-3]|uniref:tetratricopeptide repeat protein n=1 Tax=Chryseolinea sp. H1M3-3 TaxID=3034144 RepID=UPI0023EAD890|nr:tetratricopeptide repeat protein [Chryseolinea sp. H1M3-3]